MIVADNGFRMYISGAPHSGWDKDDLHDLGRVTARDFVGDHGCGPSATRFLRRH